MWWEEELEDARRKLRRWRVTAAVFAAVTVTGWIATAHFVGVARAEGAAAEARAEEIARQEGELAELRNANAELELDVEAAVEREEGTRAELEEERSSSAELTAELDEAIAAQADSSGGWIRIEVHEERLAVAIRDAELADAIATSERTQRELLEPHVCVGCAAELETLYGLLEQREELDEIRERQVAAWQAAAGSRPMFSIDVGSDWWKFAGGAVLGFFAASR